MSFLFRRALTVAFFSGLLPLTLSAQTAGTKPEALQAQVAAIAAAHHGKVALFAIDETTGQTVGLDPDTPVQTASTIKLAILYEALEQMRHGTVHLDDRIQLTAADQVPGSGVLRLLDAPLSLTFKDVLTLMVILTDNSSTNLAIDHLGLAHINDRMAALGLRNTYLYKKVFTPNPPGVVMPADQKRFGLGKTTPREIATLMRKIIHCQLAEPGLPAQASDAPLCAAAIHMLQLQFAREGLPRQLSTLPGATDTSIANKTGALDASRSDVAAISTPAGMVVIAAYTYENADHSWRVDQEGELTLSRLGLAIINAWSPAGLAPWPAEPALPAGPASHRD